MTTAGYHNTDLDLDLSRVPATGDRRVKDRRQVNNDTSAIREGVDESLTTLRGVLDELVSGGTIAYDGQIIAALDNLAQYCAISLQMIARTPL